MAVYEVTAALVVTEEVEDLILGIDWLGRHRCRWSFAQILIEIDEKIVRLISRSRQSILRRIYAVEKTTVPAGHTINVPVTMDLSSLRQTSGDWAVKPRSRSLGTGILAASSLMMDEGRRLAVQVMNVGERGFILRHGEYIGEAEQVTTVDNEEQPRGRPKERMFSRRRRRFQQEDLSRIGSGGKLRRCTHPDGDRRFATGTRLGSAYGSPGIHT